jgi:hypothetical protein
VIIISVYFSGGKTFSKGKDERGRNSVGCHKKAENEA